MKKAQAYFQRGQVNEKKGDFNSAIKDFTKALEINPALVNAAFAKAACENKIGRFEEAIKTYNDAFALEEGKDITSNDSASSSVEA
jgi:tetratricopeptide (TPR) repeat protein